jgi:hypothetical protein
LALKAHTQNVHDPHLQLLNFMTHFFIKTLSFLLFLFLIQTLNLTEALIVLSALGQSSWIDSQFEWEEQPCALCVILHFDCKIKSADQEFLVHILSSLDQNLYIAR